MQNIKLPRCTIIALIMLLLAPISTAEEMSVEDKIICAMSAAPTRISKNATITDYDGSLIRKGTNEWTCKPGGLPGSKRYPM